MKSFFAFLTIFISTLVLSVYGRYADKVVPSEIPLANGIDEFSEKHEQDTYQFFAFASNGTIVVQTRWVNDTIAIEAFFTPTGQLVAFIESQQTTTYETSVTLGYDTPSLDEIKAYRYDVNDVNNLSKRTNLPSRIDFKPRSKGRFEERQLPVCGLPCGFKVATFMHRASSP
ncbi:hypothetical protein BCR39DRAFT_556795 [Naematelia encephala]|uniref:Uncharacterized protein n=1 Tax=Naematelia encephala TaxID=71784 RepID=A0A1Y2BGS7_9TREE|nr:hypothetical protein BCR39DRAFT_556795 [Naematelia encephala]